jgi:antitoxin MazE
MRTTLHRIGNSQGVIIPKPFLTQLGLTSEVEMEIEKDAIVLRRPSEHVRAGWAEASKALAEIALDEDDLAWLDFPNEGDVELEW